MFYLISRNEKKKAMIVSRIITWNKEEQLGNVRVAAMILVISLYENFIIMIQMVNIIFSFRDKVVWGMGEAWGLQTLTFSYYGRTN
ncbi:hypothetical protein XENTR_v10014973 [Xenopus tropicalis]|nr:hypothetical protein XENTR_v10014973 [Xenopus tropicalis]